MAKVENVSSFAARGFRLYYIGRLVFGRLRRACAAKFDIVRNGSGRFIGPCPPGRLAQVDGSRLSVRSGVGFRIIEALQRHVWSDSDDLSGRTGLDEVRDDRFQ